MMDDKFGFTMAYGTNWFFWILIIVLIIWFYNVFIIRQYRKKDPRKPRPSYQAPLEILEQRYAEGKIDEEEYKQRKHHLTKDVIP